MSMHRKAYIELSFKLIHKAAIIIIAEMYRHNLPGFLGSAEFMSGAGVREG